MNILDNELVKKYFGDIQDWGPGEPVAGIITHGCSAQKILRAMQEPIKPGDLVLERFPSNTENEWQETRWPDNQGVDSWHSAFLRLPDKFQKRECECCRGIEPCSCHPCPQCHQPQREAVENFIQRIIRTGKHPNPQKYENVYDPRVLEQFLRELVRLAREGK